MLLITKFLIFLTALLIFFLFSAMSWMPRYFFLWGILMIFLVTSINFFILRKKAIFSDKLFFLITPLLFLLSSFSTFIFFADFFYKLFFSVAVSAVILLYLENLFSYFHTPANYNIYSLENISGYINLISIFFIALSTYGIKVLFGMDLYWIIGMAFLVSGIIGVLNYQLLWINKILNSRANKYLFAAGLILSQIYIIMFFLPGSYYVAGLIFALYYYVLMGIIRYKLLDKLENKIIIKYLSVGILMFFLLLFTAKWT